MTRYQFRPALIPSLATLLLLPAFIALGFWQLHRADEKRALQADYDAREAAPALRLSAVPAAPDGLRFRRMVVEGYYEPAKQILIDNRVHNGRVGYYVVTPLHIFGGEMRVLVNRGWVPLGADRAHPPEAPPPTGLQEVRGVATVPSADHFSLGKPPAIKDQWPTVWQYLDMKRYANAVPFPLQPVVILLDPSSGAGGYVRAWERLDAGIAMHEGYAFQWFAMAVALVILYVWVNIKKSSEVRK